MAKYGLQISQEGIPLERAADYQKTLDSSWPFLDIAVEQEFNFSKVNFPTSSGYWAEEIIPHNLGYIPAFTYRNISFSDNIGGGVGSTPTIVATRDKIYIRSLWISGIPQTYLNMRGFLRVFACDVTKEFISPVEKIAPRTKVSSRRYGAKILRPDARNAKMTDTEMSNFSLNPNAKALSIHQTGVREAASPNYTVVVNHNLGYPPTYFIAKLEKHADWASVYPNPIPNEDVLLPMNGSIIGLTTANNNTLTIAGAQALLTGKYAFLIVKDPIELAV